MSKKDSSKRSVLAVPQSGFLKKPQEAIFSPLTDGTSQDQNNLIRELEESLENLRQAITQSENTVSRISAALNENQENA